MHIWSGLIFSPGSCDSREVFSLRAFSNVLRIHASSKKKAEEEYFAEMQLFSPWQQGDLERWRETGTCIDEFNKFDMIYSS